MPRTNFLPPMTSDNQLNLYLSELHRFVFGIGGNDGQLDNLNIPGYHDGRVNSHEDLGQAEEITTAATTPISITSVDAGAVYDASVQALINELKADLNLLIADYNSKVVLYNELVAKLEAANLAAGGD